MKKIIIPVFLCTIIAVLATYAWYDAALKPVSDEDVRKTVTVEKGSSVDGIALLLKEKGLISSTLAFKVYVKFEGSATQLQAGKFVLKPSLSVPEIVRVLQTGKAEEMIVTIPEGFTIIDIDALLAEKGLLPAGELIACMVNCDLSEYDFLPDHEGLADRGGRVEGYLFPDTYFVVSESFTAEKFMKRLLDTFESKVVDALADDIETSGRSLHDIVTVASLVEEEAANDSERPTIAGIMWKRLDADQGLGIDATVRYIINKPTGPLTVADLNYNSPYNTRKFRGLPPGPIASPGFQSIVAAIDPKQTQYWYYLHGTDGEIRYAVTNEEHNMNKYRYLR